MVAEEEVQEVEAAQEAEVDSVVVEAVAAEDVDVDEDSKKHEMTARAPQLCTTNTRWSEAECFQLRMHTKKIA
jgi:hypothetical protein